MRFPCDKCGRILRVDVPPYEKGQREILECDCGYCYVMEGAGGDEE